MRSVAVVATVLVAGCTSGTLLRVTVGSDGAVDQCDLYVRDDATRMVVLHTGWFNLGRDITQQPAVIDLEPPGDGRYSLALVGVKGPTQDTHPATGSDQFFWADSVSVSGESQIAGTLLHVPDGDDQDQDIFPDAIAWPMHVPAAAGIPLALLDCDDKTDHPEQKSFARQINPFAPEICGDGIDQDCDGSDAPCPDRDSDGDPDVTDCKPDDPKIHHPITDPMSPHFDPFPESENCCGYALGKTGAGALLSLDGDPICHAGSCDDGIDQDCNGADVACTKDRDCDSFPASATQPMGCSAPANLPQPGSDCNDCDPSINPSAPDLCDGIDNNCNGLTDETCVSCDVDGDGFERVDAKSNCPDAAYKASGKMADCNDEDAGVFPGSTGMAFPVKVPYLAGALAGCAGAEGGSAACALRGACRNHNPDGSAQDADCDGTAARGCPPANCDADGDGFIDQSMIGACDPKGTLAPYDCDDADPHTFPNAPPQCGEGKPHNCVAIAVCATDADKDGFDQGSDCNDNNAAIHPWAVERCNGVDDDCDGLTDEGNPDGAGAPMVDAGHVLYCTDSNVGECAKGAPGHCVCSSVGVSGLHFDQSARIACPGPENATVDSGGAVAPRCYGGAQPSPEVCDGLDNDCDPGTSDGAADCPSLSVPPTCCGAMGCSDLRQLDDCLACGVTCAVANGTPYCSMTGCAVMSCLAPFGDCNNTYGDGCETNTNSDPKNCGACGTQCAANHATTNCAAGSCAIASCTIGYKNCNNTYADGCEINIGSDKNNCGDCGKVCDFHVADGCAGSACSCGFGPSCNGATSGCMSGLCLLLPGQPCMSNTQCFSNFCHNARCM